MKFLNFSLRIMFLAAVVLASANAQTLIVVHASGQKQKSLSPGCIATIYDSSVNGDTPYIASQLPLKTEANGIRVLVNKEPSALFYVGTKENGQVNLLVPTRPEWADTLAQIELQKMINGQWQTTNWNYFSLAKSDLGLFTANGAGGGVPSGVFLNITQSNDSAYYPMVGFSSNGSPIPTVHELYPSGFTRQYAVLYLTGGMYFTNRASDVAVKIGGRSDVAEVVYIGPSQFIGVQQANIELKSGALVNNGLARGQDLVLEFAGFGVLRFRNSANVSEPVQN